jgi:urease accessory protein
MSHSHSHDGPAHSHSHDHAAADHGHTHEILDGPGSYMGREMLIIEGRNWSERAFTVGIGGYVSIPFWRFEDVEYGNVTCYS